MRFTQLLLPNRQTTQQPETRKHNKQNPHSLQTIRIRLRRDVLLIRRQLSNDPSRSARAAASERGSHVRGKTRAEGILALLHAVLEDDAADDDGDGGRHIADEAKGRRRGGDIPRLDEALQRDERGLEIGSYAQAGDDLVDDDAGPGAFVVWQVDEEAEAEGEEDHSEPDGGEVVACFLDEDAYEHGGEGHA